MPELDSIENRDADFNKEIWASASKNAQASDVRYPMVNAAIAGIPLGSTQEFVQGVLGNPDDRLTNKWVYLTGTTLFGGEYIALLVTFDENNCVTDAKEVNTRTWK